MNKEILSVTEDEKKIVVKCSGSVCDCVIAISSIITEMSRKTKTPFKKILKAIKKDIEHIRRG